MFSYKEKPSLLEKTEKNEDDDVLKSKESNQDAEKKSDEKSEEKEDEKIAKEVRKMQDMDVTDKKER